MSTRLRVGTSGTQPATADDIAGTGIAGQVLARIINAIPGLADTVEWLGLTSLIPSAYAANWAVTDWYLDGTTGNDANSGTTALTPLKTGAELARRLGPYAQWGQSVTIHVLANGIADGLVLRGAMLVAGTHIDVIGMPTVASTDIIGTYTALSHGVYPGTPGTETRITGTAIVDFTPHVFQRIRNTTAGARLDTIAWVGIANPAGVGVATAGISVPGQVNTASTTNNFASQVFVAGDTFALETLPLVPSISIDVTGPILMTAGAQWDRRQFSVQSVSCPSLNIKADANAWNMKGMVFGCVLDAQYSLEPPANVSQPVLVYSACWVTGNDSQSTAKRILGPGYQNCLFGGGLGTITTYLGINPGMWFSNCLSYGKSWQWAANPSLSSFQIFDAPGTNAGAFVIAPGFSVTNLSGSRNNYGIQLLNNISATFAGTINLTGTTSDGRFFTAPATNITLTQLRQPDDYAQRGITPAMVAGTTTVTVPYYSSASQQVTVSHAVFAGTPGILSVQQISDTQFTITSSSAIDTSTVRWQISPLGRNIFAS